jgi:hypothetical protein
MVTTLNTYFLLHLAPLQWNIHHIRDWTPAGNSCCSDGYGQLIFHGTSLCGALYLNEARTMAHPSMPLRRAGHSRARVSED